MRKEPVSVPRTSHHLIRSCCCFVSLFKIRKNTMIAYALCANSVNAVKPETSTEIFILSRIHVALEQLSISFTSTKSELSALTLVGRFGTCFGLLTYFSLLWQYPKTWASYIYSASLAVIYISLKHLSTLKGNEKKVQGSVLFFHVTESEIWPTAMKLHFA